MTTRDRIAIVVTIAYIIVILNLGEMRMWDDILLFLIPIFVYWGYRFINKSE